MLVSDNLLSLINLGLELKKKLSEKDLYKIKYSNNERDFFSLDLFGHDNENEEASDVEDN